MAKRAIKPNMLEGARLLAEGMTPPAVAKTLGVSVQTIYNWLDNDAVMEEYRHCVRRAATSAVAKAAKVLIKQLDSEAGSGYLAQNAANSILTRYAPSVMGEDKQEITINITGGMPAIGVPDQADSDA